MTRLGNFMAVVVLTLSLSACGLEMGGGGPDCELAPSGGYYLTDIDATGRPYPEGYYDDLNDCEEALVTGAGYSAYPNYPVSPY